MTSVRALRNAWEVRGYILTSVKREFIARYLGSQLGWFWVIAQPLAMIVIYTLVFAAVMRPSLQGHASPFAYSIYLCSGVITWQLFSELVSRGVGVFVTNGELLKKVSLPKLTLPLVVALSAISNFAIVFALFVGFLLVIGAFPGWPILGYVPVVLIVAAFGAGLGTLLGTVNVFYRDVQQVLGLVLNFWFWLTPIVYPARSVPEWLATALQWNPMWPVVRFAQSIFLDGSVPDWAQLAYPAVLAAALLLYGLFSFRRLAAEIVDEL